MVIASIPLPLRVPQFHKGSPWFARQVYKEKSSSSEEIGSKKAGIFMEIRAKGCRGFQLVEASNTYKKDMVTIYNLNTSSNGKYFDSLIEVRHSLFMTPYSSLCFVNENIISTSVPHCISISMYACM